VERGSKFNVAKDLNKVMIIGRLGTTPELRYTANGNPVTTFRVASCRQWRDSRGELREETEWFSIVTWNKLAEICNQHLDRNARVYLEGRLQTRSWEDQQNGQIRYKTEVVANDMIILDTQRDSSAHTPPAEAFPSHNHTRPCFQDGAPPVEEDCSLPEIGDDDIPF